MCHYVTAVLPGGSDFGQARKVAQQYGRELTPIANESVTKTLRTGEQYFLTTRKGSCDCATPIGATAPDTSEDVTGAAEREIRKLRRKGWPNAKIDRLLAERATESRRRAEANEHFASTGVSKWSEFIRVVIDSGAASEMGVLLHWYDDTIEGEVIRLQKRQWLSVGELTPEFLGRIEEDTIYSFSSQLR